MKKMERSCYDCKFFHNIYNEKSCDKIFENGKATMPKPNSGCPWLARNCDKYKPAFWKKHYNTKNN